MADAVNRVVLDAVLVSRDDLRYTPAGVPVQSMLLRHASTTAEAGQERRIELDLRGVSLGAPALALSRVDCGRALRLTGFLARRFRAGDALELHITEFELLRGE